MQYLGTEVVLARGPPQPEQAFEGRESRPAAALAGPTVSLGRFPTARHSARGQDLPLPVARRSRAAPAIQSVQYQSPEAFSRVVRTPRASSSAINRSAADGSVE